MYVHFPPQGAVRGKLRKLPRTNTLENRPALTQDGDPQRSLLTYNKWVTRK